MADVTVSVSVVMPAAVAVGQSVKAVARITTDVDDGSQDTKAVVWTSSAPAVASVDATGTVRGVAVGSAIIRATVGTATGSATLAVSQPVIDITAAQEAAMSAVPVGAFCIQRGPVKADGSQVSFTIRRDA